MKPDALAHLADALAEDIVATPPHQLALEEIVDPRRSRELVFRFDDLLAEASTVAGERPMTAGPSALWNLTDALCEDIAAQPDVAAPAAIPEEQRADDRSLASAFDDIVRRDPHLARAGLPLPSRSAGPAFALRAKAALREWLLPPVRSRAAAGVFAMAGIAVLLTAAAYRGVFHHDPQRQAEDMYRLAAATDDQTPGMASAAASSGADEALPAAAAPPPPAPSPALAPRAAAHHGPGNASLSGDVRAAPLAAQRSAPTMRLTLVPPPATLQRKAVPAASDGERRVALVIGNSRYRAVPALATPQHDAETVAAALREDGFQSVTLASDLDRDAMQAALRAFRTAADAADWAVIYYAGHGIQIGSANYLVPVDAALRDARNAAAEAVSFGELEQTISGARSVKIVILDAFRGNPFGKEKGAARVHGHLPSAGLIAPPEPIPGLMVVYAALPGEMVPDDGSDGVSSPFATALSVELRKPGREVRRMFDAVRDDVMAVTGNRQQPSVYGALPGQRDFFFVAEKPDK